MSAVPIQTQFREFRNELLYQVAGCLKQKKRHPIVSGAVVISKELFFFLKEEYGLNGRFKINEQIESTFDLIYERFFNECDHTKIKNFTSRISKNKDIEIFLKILKKKHSIVATD